jgi:hypothetical protein
VTPRSTSGSEGAFRADRADFAQGDWRYFPARQRSVFVNVVWQSE